MDRPSCVPVLEDCAAGSFFEVGPCAAAELLAYIVHLETVRNIASSLVQTGVLAVQTEDRYRERATDAFEHLKALINEPTVAKGAVLRPEEIQG